MKREIKGLIFDIDGVLTYRGEVYPGAIDVMERLRERGIVVRLLTNSTLKSRRSCVDKLNRMGFRFHPDEAVTASYATACYLREHRKGPFWVLLDGDGFNEFRDLPQDDQAPESIVMGDYRSHFDFDTLNKALRLMLKGSELIAMIPELIDSTCGDIELNVGAWANMLAGAAGQEIIYIGKPHDYGFNLTLETMGLPKETVCMVGDQYSTDILGADNAGIQSIVVKTGNYEYQKHLGEKIKATWIVDSIADVINLIER